MGFLTPQAYIQGLELAGRRYKIFVEISPATSFRWEALIQKDGVTVHRESFESDAEAKEKAHRWAYSDSGDCLHQCDQACTQWESRDFD